VCGIGGVGRSVAQQLFARGTPVHLLARSSDKLAALSSTLGGAPFSAVDVTDPAALEGAVAAAGPLSGLVYAVGSIPLKPLKGTTAKDFADAMAINFYGAALAVRAAAPSLAAHPSGGSVVLFSTVAAAQGFPNHTAIAAAKGAVEAFTRSAAAELAPRVRVNCIAPSLLDTPLASRLLSSDAMRKALGDAHPVGRVGTPEDVAALTLLLLESTSWINGQVGGVWGPCFCVGGCLRVPVRLVCLHLGCAFVRAESRCACVCASVPEQCLLCDWRVWWQIIAVDGGRSTLRPKN
jgi:NAD(P)-dependent dehydrogenase (short-subunit alcohol dehydrogenase family)